MRLVQVDAATDAATRVFPGHDVPDRLFRAAFGSPSRDVVLTELDTATRLCYSVRSGLRGLAVELVGGARRLRDEDPAASSALLHMAGIVDEEAAALTRRRR